MINRKVHEVTVIFIIMYGIFSLPKFILSDEINVVRTI